VLVVLNFGVEIRPDEITECDKEISERRYGVSFRVWVNKPDDPARKSMQCVLAEDRPGLFYYRFGAGVQAYWSVSADQHLGGVSPCCRQMRS
jgi:hypothetical protein